MQRDLELEIPVLVGRIELMGFTRIQKIQKEKTDNQHILPDIYIMFIA